MIESQQYDEVVELLLQQNSLQSLNTLYDLIHPKYKKLKIKINQSINPPQNENELLLQCQLRYKHLNTLLEYGMHNEAIQMTEQLKIEIPPQYKALHYYLDLFKQMVQKNLEETYLIDKAQQIESFKQLLQEQEESNYLNQEGIFAYLLPVQWLNKWKAYVGLDHDKVDKPDLLYNTIGIKKLHQTFDIFLDDQIEEEELQTQPGPINGTLLINIIPNLWIDQKPNKRYQNYLLKQNLQEGVDFIYVSHKIYHYFENLYGGFEIKRQIIENSQGQLLIDMIPRLLTVFIINSKDPKQSYFQQFAVTAKENFDIISKKIQQKYEYQWLKFQDLPIQQEWFQNFNSGAINQGIQTAPIDIQTFEEINFIDEEIYLYEEKIGKKFYFYELKDTQSSSQQSINQLMDRFNICDVPVMSPNSRKGLTGLQNLGNTCFMNAAIQCLQNTYELTQFMIQNQFVNDLNTTNPLGTQGKIATAYSHLLKQMYYGTSSPVSPSQLKSIIGRFAQQFVGYGQQDSQELLSFLLDGLHEDMNRIKNKPIIQTIEITNETDEEASFKFWSNHLLRNRSIIIDLMGGQYKSTLVCPKCKRISKTFDPFLSLSLPIPNKQPIGINLYFVFMDIDQIPLKINVQLFQDSDALELKRNLSQITKVDESRMNLLLIKESKLRERVDNNRTCDWIHQHEGLLFVQEVDINYQSLTPDYRNINYVFTSRATKLYENEKALSFARDLVLSRNTTIYDLYCNIYLKFRPHFLLVLNLLDIKDKDYITQKQKITNLDELKEEIQFLQKQGRLPFQLRCSNKILEYDDMNTISILGQLISIDVLLEEYLKNFYPQLKLQRCKDHPQSTNNNTRRSNQHSLEDCLKLFTREEILGEGDEWYCNKCKLHVRASKKMEIYKAPKILIIHLKRFKTNKIHNFGNIYFSGQAQKISTFVQFPVEQLNLNDFVLTKQKGDETNYTYQLYAVDNHFGGTGGGHYTAFGLNPIINKWVEFDDSSVKHGVRDVVSESAYILFYRRIDAIPCSIPK